MIKHLYIFRHGETDWNLEKRVQGWIDVPLNNTGICQAQKLASILESVNLDVIYSSPLSRALETAKIVAAPNNTKILINDDLRERNNGVFGGKIVRMTNNPDDLQMDFSMDLIVMPAALMQDPDFAPENGESRNALGVRSWAAILEIAKTSNCQKIGISTHAGVARIIIDKFPDFARLFGGMLNATYFVLDWDGEKLSLNELPESFDTANSPKGAE